MKTIRESHIKELANLIGEITDYKSEFSDSFDIENFEVEKGEFVEKYFKQKFKYLIKANACFPNYFDIQNILNELATRIHYKCKKLDAKNNIAEEIIQIAFDKLKDEKPIQIDTFLPLIEGKKITHFLTMIKDYSYPNIDNIDEGKKYTIIVESTFSLKSQITKKVEQLRREFLFFSFIHQLYLCYPDYMDLFYKFFIRKYFLREKFEPNFDEENEYKFDFSSYGNFLFIIATNKTLKSFKEIEHCAKTFVFDEKDCLNDSIKKCFEGKSKKRKAPKNTKGEGKDNNIIKIPSDDNNKLPISTKKYICDYDFSESIKKISKDKFLVNSFKSFNYLLENINKEDNCKVILVYLDTYLNMITPKCFLLQKLDDIINGIQNVMENNNHENKEIKFQQQVQKNEIIKQKDYVKSLETQIQNQKDYAENLEIQIKKQKDYAENLEILIKKQKDYAESLETKIRMQKMEFEIKVKEIKNEIKFNKIVRRKVLNKPIKINVQKISKLFLIIIFFIIIFYIYYYF